jgi:hypothetical protein
MTPLIICLALAVIYYALRRRRYVRLFVKLLGTTIFFEATDHRLNRNDRQVLRNLPTGPETKRSIQAP